VPCLKQQKPSATTNFNSVEKRSMIHGNSLHCNYHNQNQAKRFQFNEILMTLNSLSLPILSVFLAI
jgi:hypothetical protein